MPKKYMFVFIISILLLPLTVEAQSRAGASDMHGALDAMDSALASDGEPTLVDDYHLGRAVAANILAVYRPYTRNAELARYLNRICQVVAINSPQPEIFNGYHVLILDSAELNAFATPGGHILVTRGLVEAAPSEDVLAAVIAHEQAHILLKHSTAIIGTMQLHNELDATADRAAGIAARENSLAARAALFRSSVTELVNAIMKNGYSQAQEFEADNAAITLLAASGYNPGALVELLRILQRAQPSQKIGLYATHPSPAERIANADRLTGRYQVQDTRAYRTSRFKIK